jgi:hypothetical protein
MNECAVYERQEADWLCIGSLNDTVLDVITWVGHDLDSVNNLGDKWPGVRERVVVSNVEGRGCPASVDEAVKVVRKFLAEGCNAGNADGIALVESGSCTWELRYSLEEKRNKMFDLAWEILNVEILDDGDVYVTPHGGTTEDGLFIITSEEIHELAELLLKHRGSGKGWKQDAWVEWCDSGEPLTKWEGK